MLASNIVFSFQLLKASYIFKVSFYNKIRKNSRKVNFLHKQYYFGRLNKFFANVFVKKFVKDVHAKRSKFSNKFIYIHLFSIKLIHVPKHSFNLIHSSSNYFKSF